MPSPIGAWGHRGIYAPIYALTKIPSHIVNQVEKLIKALQSKTVIAHNVPACPVCSHAIVNLHKPTHQGTPRPYSPWTSGWPETLFPLSNNSRSQNKQKQPFFVYIFGIRFILDALHLDLKKNIAGPGAVAHSSNTSTLGDQGGWSLEPRNSRPARKTKWDSTFKVSLFKKV